ncbi:MAG: hypothetical protein MUD01_23105 [Chloroflexaceae bacterium]|jgi:hypothetical protein|nr:hypothetical protein [Chloroflexaceae bacterium]
MQFSIRQPLMALIVLVSFLLVAAAGAQQSNITTIYLPLVMAAGAPVSPTANLQVTTATYLGGAGNDSASAVDIAPDGSLVFAGNLPGHNPGGVTPVSLLGGGDGAVVRFNSSGTAVQSITRVGSSVSDMELDDNGRIVVCGNFGVAKLQPDGAGMIWSANPGAVSRCAVGRDGTTAVASNGAVFLFNAAGTQLATWRVAGTALFDIAVDSASSRVFATGYTQDDGAPCNELQIAYLRAYDYSGRQAWQSYGWNRSEAGGANLCADTRGERVAMGRDGKLYFAGSINGGTGASVFARDPQTIGTRLDGSRNVTTDNFNNAFNTGSIKMTWFGRYTPATGALELGSSLLTRLSNSRGNSLTPSGIAADSEGRVFLVGGAASAIQNRDNRQIAGRTVAAYGGFEAYTAVFSADFRQRIVWTPFTGPTEANGFHDSGAAAVAVRDGVALVGANLNNTNRARGDGKLPLGSFLTHQALQPSPASLTAPEAYMAVWPVR